MNLGERLMPYFKVLTLIIIMAFIIALMCSCSSDDSSSPDGDTDRDNSSDNDTDGDTTSDGDDKPDGDVDSDKELEPDADIESSDIDVMEEETEIDNDDASDGDDIDNGEDGDTDEPDSDVNDAEPDSSEDGDVSDDDIESDLDYLDLPGTPCPDHPEMVLIGDSFCMDRFESIILDNENCTGTAYGMNADDYPNGFPDCVSCVEDGYCDNMLFDCGHTTDETEWAPQSEPLYACSLMGVQPSRYMTWYQANKACMNVGKTLCEKTDWITACEGPDENLFPYGNEYVDDICWENAAKTYPETPGPTGGRPGCISDYGVFDQSGNVMEWLIGCYIIGTSYNIFSSDPDVNYCDSGIIAHPYPDTTDTMTVGFRCCL